MTRRSPNARPDRRLGHVAAVRLAACLLIAVCLIPALMPGSASGDGDPASDVLLGANVFYPYGVVRESTERDLNTATARLHTQGLPIKVAVISAPVDLGAIPQLFGMPQQYAQFLAVELSNYFPRSPLLIVMPAGFGTVHFSIAEQKAIKSVRIPAHATPTDLAQDTIAAEERVARAAGLSLGAIAGPPAVVRPPSKGGSARTGFVIILASIAVLGSVGLIVSRSRTRGGR